MPIHLASSYVAIFFSLLLITTSGCNLVPDVRHKPQYHNPFPQLHRVAILPFSNQSDEPTLSGGRVSLAYYNELQSIPGFEVLPMGVVENRLIEFQQQVLKREMGLMEDFQQFARYLGVDAVLQGAITDFESYYPPRMTLKVNWYAANPGFHPIPVGYGLPWGTKHEKKIPEWIRLESERALATEQLKTQTPDTQGMPLPERTAKRGVLLAATGNDESDGTASVEQQGNLIDESRIAFPEEKPGDGGLGENGEPVAGGQLVSSQLSNGQLSNGQLPDESAEQARFQDRGNYSQNLPSDWPDPQGFIPPKPSTQRPPMVPQIEPIMSHMKAYNGNDEDFTEMLSEYFYFRDDARTGGSKAYLQRSEDFIRFCCHLHVTETLAARGGQLESRMILRWPIDRYDR